MEESLEQIQSTCALITFTSQLILKMPQKTSERIRFHNSDCSIVFSGGHVAALMQSIEGNLLKSKRHKEQVEMNVPSWVSLSQS